MCGVCVREGRCCLRKLSILKSGRLERTWQSCRMLLHRSIVGCVVVIRARIIWWSGYCEYLLANWHRFLCDSLYCEWLG